MVIRKVFRSLIAVSLVVATAFVASPAVAVEHHSSDPGLVRVDSGWLRGGVADDHIKYSAIPYAAPPVGERRWRPPVPAARWSGVRDATTPSPLCPQRGEGDTTLGQEDCLFLDVTVPRATRRDGRLPVLVWVHGGGFDSGGAKRYEGVRLATQGDMVVVTINYRLGALGFLSSPELDSTGGNYGLMDQAAALRWVRDNAARFGGNPHNVTLAGQSAGARAICAQLASPFSRGLYHRAITQSGACDNAVVTRDAGREFGDRAIQELGCDKMADIAACLRRQTPAELVRTLSGVGTELNGRASDRPWNPVAETMFLPKQPAEALREGTAARVPLLVGATRDEMRGFVSAWAPKLTEDEYRTMMTETFGDQAGTVLEEYPVEAYETPAFALSAVISDWGGQIGACPVLRTAETASTHQRVYAYEFTEDAGPNASGFPMGSYHGLEQPYLWTLLGFNPYPPLSPAQKELSKAMIDYWSAFVHTGDPNGPGRPRWSAFDATGTVIELSAGGIAPTPFAETHRCDFWAGLPR